MSTVAADFVSYRFSTRELPERMRIPLWRENFGRGIVHVDPPGSQIQVGTEADQLVERGHVTRHHDGRPAVDGGDADSITVGRQ